MSRINCIKPRITMLKTDSMSIASTKRITGRKCQQIKRAVALRDGLTCRACGKLTTRGEADHVVPLHLGGQESDYNRQWLCVECHNNKTKEEAYAWRGAG